MKKITIFAAIMICFGSMVFAQKKTLSSSQMALRNSIQSYLKTEGFQPTIDDDGDIKFKRQGTTFFVSVSATDDSPMYVSLSSFFNYNDNITHTKLTLFSTNNDYKMCKIVPLDNHFVIKCQMYLTNASSFTSILYKLLNVQEGVIEDLRDL